MKRLAIDGGESAIKAPLRKWHRHCNNEREALRHFADDLADGHAELSGYLAGVHEPGPHVRALEEAWAAKFKVKHAIACNSATSGLMAASYAAYRLTSATRLAVPALTMSATETATVSPIFTMLRRFVRADIDRWGCAVPDGLPTFDAAVVTDLFGHPAQIDGWRNKFIISDSSQAVLATDENGNYAGTTADVGVYSLNVHKQLNAGEGGIVVTNRDDVAEFVRDMINHGELRKEGRWGLNLRMTELTAIIAKCQLDVAEQLIWSRQKLRVSLAQRISFASLPDREGCLSACYCMPIMFPDRRTRDYAIKSLNAEGFPIRAGYAHPQFYAELPPRAHKFNDELGLIELCAIDPTAEELGQIEEAFDKVADNLPW